MNNDNYEQKSIKELQSLCKEASIKGISKKNKSELINIFKSHKDDVNAILEDDLCASLSLLDLSNKDTYTKEVLSEQFSIHKEYVIKRSESAKKLNIK